MKYSPFSFLFFAGFILFVSPNLSASHLIGGTITYQYIGNDSFHVSSEFFRDCNVTQALVDQFTVTPSGSASPYTVTTTQILTKDITPVTPGTKTRCYSNTTQFPFGIQQVICTGTFKADKNICDYNISVLQCCLGSGISTGAADDDFYNEANLNICEAGYNNSPQFISDPLLISCVNTCTTSFQNAAANPGDSLSYSLVSPMSSAGTVIPYTSPYSYDAPLLYFGNKNDKYLSPNCNGFHFDSITAEIDFKAKKDDQTVICIKVDQWHKNSSGIYKKIGSITRQTTYAIIDCPSNQPPIVTGINGGNNFTIYACTLNPISFNIKAFDLDPPDTVTLTWKSNIPNSYFDIAADGKKWPTAKFSWSPSAKDYPEKPYTFSVTASDNKAPIPGKGTRIFTIYLNKDSMPKVNIATKQITCNTYNINAVNDSALNLNYTWNIDSLTNISQKQSLNYQFTDRAKHYVDLLITRPNGCAYTIPVTIIIDTTVLPRSSFNAGSTCNGTPLYLKNTSTPAPKGGALNYLWNFGDGTTSTNSNPTKTYSNKGKFLVSLIAKTLSGCTDSVGKIVSIGQGPVAKISTIVDMCHSLPTKFSDKSISQFGDSIISWNWKFGDGTNSTTENPNHNYKGSGLFNISLEVVSKAGCIDSANSSVTIPTALNAGFSAVRTGTRAYNFIAADNTLSKYDWDFGDTTSGAGSNVKHTYQKDSLYTVTLRVTNANNCIELNSDDVNVNSSGIKDEKPLNGLNLKLSPNPFPKALNFSFELTKQTHINIKIIDITGKTIASIADGVQNEGIHDYTFKAEDYQLKPGIYSLIIESDGNKVTKEIVKQ